MDQTIVMFSEEIDKEDLKNFETSDLFIRYKRSMSHYRRLSFQEEQACFVEAEESSPEENIRLRWKVAVHNLPLVIYIAGRFGHRLPFMDRIQEGNIGLLVAATRFDFRREVHFGTYADWWIRAMIIRAQSKEAWNGGLIRCPSGIQRVFFEVQVIQQRLFQHLGRNPSSEEILHVVLEEQQHKAEERWKKTGWKSTDKPVKKKKSPERADVELILIMLNEHVVSLDSSPHAEDVSDTSWLYDMIPDPQVCPQDVWMEVKQRLEEILLELGRIDQCISKFHERSAVIVRHRLGLPGYEKETLKSLGDRFDLSKERVRQIENLELKRLERITGVPRARMFRLIRTAEELQKIVSLV